MFLGFEMVFVGVCFCIAVAGMVALAVSALVFFHSAAR